MFDEIDNLQPIVWDSKVLTQAFGKRVLQRLIAKFVDRQDLVDFYERIVDPGYFPPEKLYPLPGSPKF